MTFDTLSVTKEGELLWNSGEFLVVNQILGSRESTTCFGQF